MNLFQETEVSEPTFFDNEVLDQFLVPFGEWTEQGVFWIDNELGWLLDTIKAPFDFLLELLVTDFLEVRAWWIVVLLMFMIGWTFRSLKVGLFALVGLSFCGVLGPAFWTATAQTIGFIFVAVILCVIIGIPVGIACGRVDSVWSVVRPVLDAMQVVHSFVYMLPFIFFFGLGETAATMVTMVFALPPLIRLTNLGIRQVPEDVVEASRSYGAPEYRVLLDVQIPLARPAIMTGVNQTLLLAISMLGIAAIMGAGGLGQLMFRALSSQDVAAGAAAGLAFFLVAVVLDRISQPTESNEGSLLTHLRTAMANRQNPEAAFQDADALAAETAEQNSYGGHPAPLAAKEGLGLKVALGGAVLGLVSVFLTWGQDAGMVTSHSRFTDLDLPGATFGGLDAEGGSFFGVMVLIASVFVILATAVRLSRPDGPRYLSADGATLGGFLGLGGALGYLLMSPAPDAASYSNGIGIYVAVVGMLIAVAGGLLACTDAPYAPHRPVASTLEIHKLFGAVIAIAVLYAGSISGWSFDQRDNSVLSDADIANVELLREQAEAIPALAPQNAVEISAIYNAARRFGKEIHDSWNDAGPGFGPLLMLLGLLGVGAVVMAAGTRSTEQHHKWRWSVLSMGIGISIAAIAAAWIGSLARASEGGFLSGIGAFLVLLGGVFFVSSGRALVNEFFRIEVFDDEVEPAAAAESADTEKVAESV